MRPLEIVFLGLSITSSWGNGHAVTYRGLVRELCVRGHHVLFLERDAPWYADNRDLPRPPYGVTAIYGDLDELYTKWLDAIRSADLVVVGSFVPDGVDVLHLVIEHARGVRAFYDIDTPVTLQMLEARRPGYLDVEAIPELDLYLSFTGGPTLQRLERTYGARRARALYCSADLGGYRPLIQPMRWDLGYLGTYSPDRQPRVDRLLDAVARRRPDRKFVVAGPQYPTDIEWSPNVARIEHLAPAEHPAFYGSQRLTLNVTRDEMIRAGYSPSIRLFEAAACGTAIVSDAWPGLETFFTPGEEILVANTTEDVLELLEDPNHDTLSAVGKAARRRVLTSHTAAHRAAALEQYVLEVWREHAPRVVSVPVLQGGRP